MCRKAQGCAFATNADVARKDFQLLQGAELITEYESSEGKLRCFCRVCGSPIYSHRVADPASVRVRFGTLDGDPGVRAWLTLPSSRRRRGSRSPTTCRVSTPTAPDAVEVT